MPAVRPLQSPSLAQANAGHLVPHLLAGPRRCLADLLEFDGRQLVDQGCQIIHAAVVLDQGRVTLSKRALFSSGSTGTTRSRCGNRMRLSVSGWSSLKMASRSEAGLPR